jgi:hypothetical protein
MGNFCVWSDVPLPSARAFSSSSIKNQVDVEVGRGALSMESVQKLSRNILTVKDLRVTLMLLPNIVQLTKLRQNRPMLQGRRH